MFDDVSPQTSCQGSRHLLAGTDSHKIGKTDDHPDNTVTPLQGCTNVNAAINNQKLRRRNAKVRDFVRNAFERSALKNTLSSIP